MRRGLLLVVAVVVYGLPSRSSVSGPLRALQADEDALQALAGAADDESSLGAAVGDDDPEPHALEKRRVLHWEAERTKLTACVADAPAADADCAREKWYETLDKLDVTRRELDLGHLDEHEARAKESAACDAALREYVEEIGKCDDLPTVRAQSHMRVTQQVGQGPTDATRPLVQWIQAGQRNTLYIHQLQHKPEYYDAMRERHGWEQPDFDTQPQEPPRHGLQTGGVSPYDAHYVRTPAATITPREAANPAPPCPPIVFSMRPARAGAGSSHPK